MMMHYEHSSKSLLGSRYRLWVLVVLVFIGGLTGSLCIGIPQWNVYQKKLSGEGHLRQAEFNRQIAVVEAHAERDAAELRRQTAIIRAEGIAEANRIIGTSITPEYIQWLWVDGLHTGNHQIIYVPTEANLPILEAFRNFQRSIQPNH